MNVVLAIIANGGRAVVVIYREAVEIKYFILYFIILYLTLQWWPLPTPFEEAPGGGVCSSMETMVLEGETAPSWWGCLCDVCFASIKSSEREFLVPAGTHLGVRVSC
jgi:hypothetical protein